MIRSRLSLILWAAMVCVLASGCSRLDSTDVVAGAKRFDASATKVEQVRFYRGLGCGVLFSANNHAAWKDGEKIIFTYPNLWEQINERPFYQLERDALGVIYSRNGPPIPTFNRLDLFNSEWSECEKIGKPAK